MEQDQQLDSNAAEANPNNSTKLTDWKKEPTVAELELDFTESESSHSTQVTKVTGWLDQLNMTGSAKIPKKKGFSNVQPKLIRKQAEWRYAALSEPFLSTDDVFNADPVTFEDKDAAEQNGLVLNNQFNTKIDKIRFFDEYVRTAVDEGTVIVKVAWDYKEEITEVEVPTIEYQVTTDPAAIQQIQQLIQLSQQSPEQFQELPVEMQKAVVFTMQTGKVVMPIQTGVHMEEQTVVLKNHPTLEVCNYKNVRVDPSCNGVLRDAGFITYSYETSLSKLKEADKYKNLDKILKSGVDPLSSPDHEIINDDQSFNFKDDARKKIVAKEYWGYKDIHGDNTVVPIVATWVNGIMIQLEENPFPDKEHPFVSAQMLPVRKSIYGEPDGELLKENQAIVGAVTRGMVDIMGRSANAQTGSRKDALDITNKRKYDSGQDYEFNPQVDPRTAFHMHQYPEIPQSAEIMLNYQNTDAESLTGVKAFSSGISGAALGNTATGIRSALDATSKRELGILRRLAEGVKEIGRKMISMNGVFLSDEEVIRVTNEEFITIKRDDLEGKFDLRLTISTAEADNQKAEDLSFMLQTMGNNMDPAMSRMMLSEQAKLRNMPTLAKKIEDFQPQPDPLEEKRRELEIVLLEAQIETERSKSIENLAEANLDDAKAGKEQAMAGNLSSDTDLKNLDFLETESGTKHERELDKQAEGASQSRQLRAVDSVLKQQENAANTSTPAL